MNILTRVRSQVRTLVRAISFAFVGGIYAKVVGIGGSATQFAKCTFYLRAPYFLSFRRALQRRIEVSYEPSALRITIDMPLCPSQYGPRPRQISCEGAIVDKQTLIT